ncbi:hypothetical protein ACVWZ8_003606 [Arthrobacter sp. UYCu723]
MIKPQTGERRAIDGEPVPQGYLSAPCETDAD